MPTRGKITRDRFTAASGLLGAAILTSAWVAAGIFESHYSNLRQDISDFGALTASHPLPYNVAVSTAGTLIFLFAIGLLLALGRGLTARLGSLAVMVVGAGLFLDGLVREDCSPSGDRACRAALDAWKLSWHHEAHDIESACTLAAIILAPLLVGFAFRARERWRDLYPWSLAASFIAFVAIVWYGVLYVEHKGSAYSGALERAVVGVGSAWIAVVSLTLYRLAEETQPDTSREDVSR